MVDSTAIDGRRVVMVSSTAIDLPRHRKGVLDACYRLDMFPKMMEHLPAGGADAVSESHRLLDESDIYIGVFGFRYGYVPPGYDVSITELEYEWALAREGMPKLIFLMAEDHPVTVQDVDQGEFAAKAKQLRERLQRKHVTEFFHSPDDLRAR